MIDYSTDLTKLENAIARLTVMLNLSDSQEGKREATIQCFEFVVELYWKLLKHMLKHEQMTAYTPREVFKEAFAAGWLDHEELWSQMLTDRNLTSHTYNEDLANEILGRIATYKPMIDRSFLKLRQLVENW